MKQKLVVLSGAGISAESGLQTFRDSDGLWEGYRVESVATPEAFHHNPDLVLEFYNQRRQGVKHANPNAAHYILADLQKDFDVHIITQNIDDLHERAGSKTVTHLHGEIFKMRSVKNDHITFPINGAIKVGQLAPDGGQLRPHIVWFGEAVPMIESAMEVVASADIFLVIGTSLAVYPAAGLLSFLPPSAKVYVVDKHIPTVNCSQELVTIEAPATLGMKQLQSLLLNSR